MNASWSLVKQTQFYCHRRLKEPFVFSFVCRFLIQFIRILLSINNKLLPLVENMNLREDELWKESGATRRTNNKPDDSTSCLIVKQSRATENKPGRWWTGSLFLCDLIRTLQPSADTCRVTPGPSQHTFSGVNPQRSWTGWRGRGEGRAMGGFNEDLHPETSRERRPGGPGEPRGGGADLPQLSPGSMTPPKPRHLFLTPLPPLLLLIHTFQLKL